MMWPALLFAALLLTAGGSVVDGDTMKIGATTVRLHGIDAPELRQACNLPGGRTWACGEAAAVRLGQLVHGRSVACEALDVDRYGRLVARCVAGGVDVGAALVREGLGWAYVKYSREYAADEAAARAGGRGVWSAGNVPAWEWRAARR
jgi:endonuclease YncB( thermonuclease family)